MVYKVFERKTGPANIQDTPRRVPSEAHRLQLVFSASPKMKNKSISCHLTANGTLVAPLNPTFSLRTGGSFWDVAGGGFLGAQGTEWEGWSYQLRDGG